MRTNRVVRKSIKKLRSKNKRNRVNRKTKKRTQKRVKITHKRTKRAKRNKRMRGGSSKKECQGELVSLREQNEGLSQTVAELSQEHARCIEETKWTPLQGWTWNLPRDSNCKPYYWNPYTNKSQWDIPTEPALSQSDQEMYDRLQGSKHFVDAIVNLNEAGLARVERAREKTALKEQQRREEQALYDEYRKYYKSIKEGGVAKAEDLPNFETWKQSRPGSHQVPPL